MSIEIAQKKIALHFHREEAKRLIRWVHYWFDRGYISYGKNRLKQWSSHMHYCKRLKREIAEAEGHYNAKEVAFNGKFAPKR